MTRSPVAPAQRAAARLALLLLASLATAAATAPAATAQTPTWSEARAVARTVTPGCTPSFVALERNRRGDALLAWVEPCVRRPRRLVVASRPAGGSYGAPRPLGRIAFSSHGDQIRLGLDEQGGAVVAWAHRDTAMLAVRPPGGRFSRGVAAARGAGIPELAVAESGDAVAVWESGGVMAASLAPGEARFAAPVRLSKRAGRIQLGPAMGVVNWAIALTVDVAADGTAVAAWSRIDRRSRSCCTVVEAAVRPAGGAFGPAQELTRPQRYIATDAVGAFAAGAGRALVAWPSETAAGPGVAPGMHAARWDGARFAAPVALAAFEANSSEQPAIEALRDGTPLVHWTTAGGTTAVAVPFDGVPAAPRGLGGGLVPQLDAQDRLVSAGLWITDERCDRYQLNCTTLAMKLRTAIEGQELPVDPRYQRMTPRAGAFAAGPLDPPTLVLARRGGVEEIVLNGE